MSTHEILVDATRVERLVVALPDDAEFWAQVCGAETADAAVLSGGLHALVLGKLDAVLVVQGTLPQLEEVALRVLLWVREELAAAGQAGPHGELTARFRAAVAVAESLQAAADRLCDQANDSGEQNEEFEVRQQADDARHEALCLAVEIIDRCHPDGEPGAGRLPESPAVRFDSDAAREWLLEPLDGGMTRAERYDIGPDRTYSLPARPDFDVNVIGEWLESLFAELGHAPVPHVWHTAPGVTVDITVQVTIEGSDGGGYLFAETGGVRLASRELFNADFAKTGSTWPEAVAKTELDVAVEALTTCAATINTIVESHRLAVTALAAAAAGAGAQ